MESDLYPPLKSWLEQCGYTVHAEVGGCDIAARRGDELTLIEIKQTINLDLLLQLSKRKQACDSVYAAVAAPTRRDKRWRELQRLLKHLCCGLLLVHTTQALKPWVELSFHPAEFTPRKNKKVARALLTEMAGRTLDLNLGGSNKIKLMTAYREQALLVAVALAECGPASPRQLRQCGASQKTAMIVRDNYYGWFVRLERGIYDLTSCGREALANYPQLVPLLREKLDFSKIAQ